MSKVAVVGFYATLTLNIKCGRLRYDVLLGCYKTFFSVTKGNTPYSKVLKEWSQNKEKESYSLNSGFGVIREGMFDFSRKGRSSKRSSKEDATNKNVDQRRVSIVDARSGERDWMRISSGFIITFILYSL